MELAPLCCVMHLCYGCLIQTGVLAALNISIYYIAVFCLGALFLGCP